MLELPLSKASEDGLTSSAIAAMISMAETGTRTIALTKGHGHLAK